ncbi:MAG: tRNA uridine-5-carboxymethylaminomethyl(34) synthesis GTPase MnmE [Clostridiales bacterium]|nr:tRNA uridine-5-carboxymethylaminomethyl(34) synthesis GTPase MnmE [Clostridiales bacterium]
MSFDTIAAISTPRGKGGVALIRISGADAADIGDRIFRPKNKKPLSAHTERTAVFGDIVGADGAAVDSGLAVLFRAPRSFTGEDTVEISCHGGVLVSAAVLGAALAAGARQAEAGEFTRRAYAAGKLTLTEAESLGMLLDARTDSQLRLARGGMSGVVSRASEELSSRISEVLGDIYARVDFPDEDLGELSTDEVIARLEDISACAGRLAATYSTGRAIAEGIPTVICGRTNAGKSTLYNRMTGEDSAIVTAAEGTTRDILTETVSFGGVTLRLSDTAGIREGQDEAERIGIDRARERIRGSELVLFLIDGSREPDADEYSLADELTARGFGRVIAVLGKSDLTDGVNGAVPAAVELWSRFADRAVISASSGEGMDALANMVAGIFLDSSLSPETDAVVQNERQYAALKEARQAIDEAREALAVGFSPDVAGISLESALSSLRAIDGRGVCAEVVDGIFAKFCVGK